jgi:hypothetical protein
MNTQPNLKIYEEFCSYYEKDTPESKAWLFKQYEFAIKERQRLRDKDRRSREKKKLAKAALPPVPGKKRGPKGPWKHKKVAPVSENSPVPGSAELPK